MSSMNEPMIRLSDITQPWATEERFRLQRRERYQRDQLDLDLMPGEHLDLTVSTSGKAGEQLLNGFGSLRVRAMEGRGLVIEIADELNGVTLAAQVDLGRPRRARPRNLQAPLVTRAIEDASREDGPEPWVMPMPDGWDPEAAS